MTTQLGINEHHQNQVINYIRFARYQRSLRLRAVDGCFEDLKASRLIEETFTLDEVTEMLDGLLTVVRSEVESELINTAHTNVLLMRQVFQQAEKWHLKMQADISELENRELLEQIKEFEEQEFAGAKRDTEFMPKKLQPLNETGGTLLLQMRIDELQQETDELKRQLGWSESQIASSRKQEKMLEEDLAKARALGLSVGQGSEGNVELLRKQLANTQASLEQSQKVNQQSSRSMEGDLVSTKHELLRIREMLELAEKELEKKVSQTMPFKNLKQMLQKKNEQLKEFRKRLAKYETVSDD